MTKKQILTHTKELDERLETACMAAFKAGNLILDFHKKRGGNNFKSVLKKQNDLVTEVDKASEELITRIFAKKYPSISILGEEFGFNGDNTSKFWVIDPLDGTTNFAHGFPQFSVSIGLVENGKVVLGCVYEVVRNELFYASKGKGAFVNGEKISVSKNPLSSSLVATGFPYHDFSHLDEYLKTFKEVVQKTHGIRRPGSAASDLAYIAAGRFDSFWEFNLKPWDLAAGLILIKEAGGIITDFDGSQNMLKTGNVVAGGKRSQAELLEIVYKNYKKLI